MEYQSVHRQCSKLGSFCGFYISGEKEKFWFRGESRKKALERKPTVEEFLKVSGFFHLIVKGLSYLESVWSFSKGFG